MIPVLDTNAWIEKLRELERPGADNILAFYEHRFGAICRDPRLMLAPLDDPCPAPSRKSGTSCSP